MESVALNDFFVCFACVCYCLQHLLLILSACVIIVRIVCCIAYVVCCIRPLFCCICFVWGGHTGVHEQKHFSAARGFGGGLYMYV